MKSLADQINFLFKEADFSDWQTVKFGDIAFNISERVEPDNTTAEIYIGLEHLDSDSVHILRSGVPSDVKGTKLKVYKGDIIFGKRRAYQRKAAIASFDGICSAHAMVLRANPEVVDPNFFPFLIHSDAFMDKAVEISEGSLSPTIKWKTLKEQSFRVPPLAIQAKLSELLWSIDGVEESYKDTIQKLYIVLQSEFEGRYQAKNSTESILENIANINPTLSREESLVSGQVDFIPMEAISEDGDVINICKKDFLQNRNSLTNFKNGDIIFAKITPCMENGKGALIETLSSQLALGSTEFHVLRPKFTSDRFYIYYLTKLPFFRRLAERYMTGSAGQKRVPVNFLKTFKLRVPSVKQREQLGVLCHNIWHQKRQCEEQLNNIKKLKKAIVNTIL